MFKKTNKQTNKYKIDLYHSLAEELEGEHFWVLLESEIASKTQL